MIQKLVFFHKYFNKNTTGFGIRRIDHSLKLRVWFLIKHTFNYSKTKSPQSYSFRGKDKRFIYLTGCFWVVLFVFVRCILLAKSWLTFLLLISNKDNRQKMKANKTNFVQQEITFLACFSLINVGIWDVLKLYFSCHKLSFAQVLSHATKNFCVNQKLIKKAILNGKLEIFLSATTEIQKFKITSSCMSLMVPSLIHSIIISLIGMIHFFYLSLLSLTI